MENQAEMIYYARIINSYMRLKSVADALYKALKSKTDPTFETDVCDTCAVSSYERWIEHD